MIKRINFRKIDGSKKNYPRVLQLPITYFCNSKCVMCNIWRMDYSNEMPAEEFAEKIKDPIFSKVKIVGINGGEPSLVKNLPLYVKEILKLPKLKHLNIITHGFNPKLLFPSLEEIYSLCKKSKILFHVSVSLDGYGKIHDDVRGLKVFELTQATIDEIKNNKHKYCDTYDVGCTIMKQNIDFINELDAFAQYKNYNIKYRLAIENKRIESDMLKENYSLLFGNITQSAKEFFHNRYRVAKTLYDKFKYFAIFYFLVSEKKKRLIGCDWKEDGITMDSRGDLYYCAVESHKIGELRKTPGKEIFFDNNNIKYRESIVRDKCDNCIHDYNGNVHISSIVIFLKYLISEKFYWITYYLKARLI